MRVRKMREVKKHVQGHTLFHKWLEGPGSSAPNSAPNLICISSACADPASKVGHITSFHTSSLSVLFIQHLKQQFVRIKTGLA